MRGRRRNPRPVHIHRRHLRRWRRGAAALALIDPASARARRQEQGDGRRRAFGGDRPAEGASRDPAAPWNACRLRLSPTVPGGGCAAPTRPLPFWCSSSTSFGGYGIRMARALRPCLAIRRSKQRDIAAVSTIPRPGDCGARWDRNRYVWGRCGAGSARSVETTVQEEGQCVGRG